MPEGLPFEKLKTLGADLQTHVREGAHPELLHDWIGDDEGRKMYLDGMVFATIRWDKLRGRPKSGPLSRAVVVHHWAERVQFWPIPERKPALIDDVFTYDMADDADNHHVGLVCKALVGIEGSVAFPGSNDVDVFPAPAVPWESVERPMGLGDPRVGYGNHFVAHEGGGFLILPDYVFD
jgi:hypothetical protein